jgi:plastocyanin
VRIRLAAVGLVFLALPATASAAEYTVTATSGNTFTPATVNIAQGDTVVWQNQGGNHNVKFDDGSFEQPSDAAPPALWPSRVARTFNAAGTFPYYCELHGGPGKSGMAGEVNVAGAGGGGPGGNQPTALQPPLVDSLRARARRGRRIGVAINASFASLAHVTIARRVRGRYRTAIKFRRKVGARTKRLTVARDRRRRALKPGRYRVSVQLQDDAGQNKGVKGPVETDTVVLR